jgi:hypothetical protein
MPLEEMVYKIMKFSTAVLKLPGGGQRQPLPYILTLFPPLVLALLSPDIFYKALDFAGTYGGVFLHRFSIAEQMTNLITPLLNSKLFYFFHFLF